MLAQPPKQLLVLELILSNDGLSQLYGFLCILYCPRFLSLGLILPVLYIFVFKLYSFHKSETSPRFCIAPCIASGFVLKIKIKRKRERRTVYEVN